MLHLFKSMLSAITINRTGDRYICTHTHLFFRLLVDTAYYASVRESQFYENLPWQRNSIPICLCIPFADLPPPTN